MQRHRLTRPIAECVAQFGSPSIDGMAPRPSVDSKERPFEHWYRGEVSRNGGVGELRVGRRMEMLEIASYGHESTRPADYWRNGGTGVRRRRAGSTDARLHDSFSWTLRAILKDDPPRA
jgi:hypothetical protein